MRLLSPTTLLLQEVVTHGAAHVGGRENIQQTSTSTLSANTATQALVVGFDGATPQATKPSHTIDHNKSSDNKDKRADLAAVHQAAEDDYQQKLHEDDEYAEWAKDPNLNRGPAWNKIFRSLLYKHPGEWQCSVLYSAQLCTR